MKKSLFYILLIFIPVFFLAGCKQLNQNQKPLESKIDQKKISGEERNLSANYFFLESRIHIKNKEYSKAMTSLKKALAKDPSSFVLTRDLVRLYLRQNNDKKAITLAEDLVQKNPDNVDGLLFLIQLKKNSIEEKELVGMLNKVLLLDPENKETFLRLGKIYLEEENIPAALELFKKMAEQFPDYYVAWFYLGKVYMAGGKQELAATQFLKTIELEPDLVEPRLELIKIYSNKDILTNKEKILNTYDEILEIEPENLRALLGKPLLYYKTDMKEEAQSLFMELGRDVKSDSRLVMIAFDEYISNKRYKDAVIVFSQMLKGDPDNSTLNFFTGMAHEAIDDIKKAISFYLRIRPDHSQYKKTILSIASLYKQLGEEKTALNYLNDKYKLYPKDIDIIAYLASFYEKDAHYEKATDLLKKGLKDSPDNTSLLFRLGAIQDKAGLKKESMTTMEKIIELDPKDASALNYLGYSYAELGTKLDKALLLIKRAYEIRPDDGYITDSLGWVYYKQGDYENAVKYLEKAAELTSFETIISDHLGDAYRKTNQFKQALETYKKAVANAKEADKEKVIELKKKIEAVLKN